MPTPHEMIAALIADDWSAEQATLIVSAWQREQDRRLAEKAWRKVETDDETRDHYRAKHNQD